MAIKVNKHPGLTQLFYYAAMLFLLAGITGYVILYTTAANRGMPVFMVDSITGLFSSLSTTDVMSGAGPLTLIFSFLVRYRNNMLVIGLILTVIQAWLKHDAGLSLTLGNILARPVANASDAAPTPRPAPRPAPDSKPEQGKPEQGKHMKHLGDL